MHVIHVSDVDDGLMAGMRCIVKNKFESPSRNGLVWRADAPVATVYRPNTNFVSFLPARNANPFFHLMEALWMLAGRNDLTFVSQYAAQMKFYSDDGGVTQPGAYGFRWRQHFGYDQLIAIIDALRGDPLSRRIVLSMWDGHSDVEAAARGSTDVPCNTHVYFDATMGPLNMTVCCRSNDIVWGCYGSNAVHFSLLHEFVSSAAGLHRGTYTQLSNNFHMYIERPDVLKIFEYAQESHYGIGPRPPVMHEMLLPVADDYIRFFKLLAERLDALGQNRTGIPFLDRVAEPMQTAWARHKAGDTKEAIRYLGTAPIDWLTAGRRWLERALERKAAKEST